MTKNTLNDLNNHLFEQIERLNDDDLKGENLETETKRAKAISSLAKTIIDNASLGLEAEKFRAEYRKGDVKLPEMLENKKDK